MGVPNSTSDAEVDQKWSRSQEDSERAGLNVGKRVEDRGIGLDACRDAYACDRAANRDGGHTNPLGAKLTPLRLR
jgi:hypothetical protein